MEELLNYYPGSADALELSIVMTDLFMQLYTQGYAAAKIAGAIL